MDKIYKLLRDNRQTGPHTLEELVALGLKPFDLIWADGKTAGWMYPSEIDTLKPYLPKEKGEPVKAAESISSSPYGVAPSTPEPVVSTSSFAERSTAIPSSAKHIFISMPAGVNPVKMPPVQTTPGAKPITEEETPEQKLERKAIELRQRVQAAAEAKKAQAEEPALDTKYARSLEDIKEEYAHWMHEQRSKEPMKRNFSGTLSKKQWMRAALVLVVAGAGYGVIKWVTAPGVDRLAVVSPQASTTAPAVPATTPEKKEEPLQSVVNTDYSDRNADLLDELEQANKQIEEDLKRFAEKKKGGVSPPVGHSSTEPDLPETYDTYEEDTPPVAYEPKKRPSDPPASPPVRTVSYRTEKKAVPLSQQIDVQAKYLRASRGKGLEGVELRLRNNSAQVLKTVAIDVFYYRQDNRLMDKETVYLNDVQPGENLTVTAPGNKRASSATYQLGLISADGGLYVAKTPGP